MAPKKKPANKNKAGGGVNTEDIDLSEIPNVENPNIVIGEIQSVKQVPNGTLRQCYVEVANRDEEVFIITTSKVEEGQMVVVALAPTTLPNGLDVQVRNIGGYDSEGVMCGPQELLWPTSVFRADMPVTLAQGEVGDVPTYEECVALAKPKKAEKKKGGKNNKKGGAGEEDDDDFDQLLKDFGVVDEKANKNKKAAPAAKKEEPKKDEAKKEEPAAKSPTAGGDKDGDDSDDGNEEGLTAKQIANRRKKQKKREAEKAAKEAAAKEAEEAANKNKDEPAAEPSANQIKKGKMKNARAELIKEQLRQKQEEERAEKEFMEAQRKAIEEEERKEKEAEAAKEAAAKAKKEAKEKEIETQKRLGTYKTAAQKKKEAEAAAKRQQLIDAGVIVASVLEEKKESGPQLIEVTMTQAMKDFFKKKLAFKKKEWIVDAPWTGDEDIKKLDALFSIKKEASEEEDTQYELTEKKFAIGQVPAGRVIVLKRIPKVQTQVVDDRKKAQEKKKQQQLSPDVPKPEEKKEEPKREPSPAKRASVKKEEEVAADEDSDLDWLEEEERAEAQEALEKEAKELGITVEQMQRIKNGETLEEVTKVEEKTEEAEEDGEEDEEGDEDDEEEADSDSSEEYLGFRSPIVCIMGHVDTGKTKLLDKIRRTNVQDGEAGGITQQIGATYFPEHALEEQLVKVDKNFELEVPGLLIIDTPGHESFNNLRSRGSSLADLAILVIDIMHGLEPQTLESLEMLKQRKTNFVVALNKCDVCYGWEKNDYTDFRSSLAKQPQSAQDHFNQLYGKVQLALAEKGLNAYLYWENPNIKQNVCVIPTSAHSGEGVPDLLYMIIHLSQQALFRRLEIKRELQCKVLEVKAIEGLGTTIDVVLVNGELNKGDQIVVPGLNGPIVTTVRALLTPQPMKEMRVKGEYVNHRKIDVSMGIKICALGLENAIAGTNLRVCNDPDELEEVKEDVEDEFEELIGDMFEKEDCGVYVQASTLGSLEALQSFLKSQKIPVFCAGIGTVSKKDVKKASLMREKGKPEYACILAFDVKIDADAKKEAARSTCGVTIFSADIIYHLKDMFEKYMAEIQEQKKKELSGEAVFPCVLKIIPEYIFNKRDPIVIGVDVVEGVVKMDTPICIPEHGNLEIGRIAGIERDKVAVKQAKKGENVCVKIQPNAVQNHIQLGRHFSTANGLYSKITRQSIDVLKANYQDEMTQEWWKLVVSLKKVFNIQ